MAAAYREDFTLLLLSHLTLQLVDHWGMTLIECTSGERFKVYTQPERIEAR